jgi:hypothetical protein
MTEMLETIDVSNIISSEKYKLRRKCYYIAHATTIYSVEQAISILDYIGLITNSEDCLPFSLRLVENGELIQIAEDNGEFGIGDLLADSLNDLDGYNLLICVSRKSADCTVHEMYQSQKRIVIKNAAKSAINKLHDHLNINSTKKRSDDDRTIMTAPHISRMESRLVPPKILVNEMKEYQQQQPMSPLTASNTPFHSPKSNLMKYRRTLAPSQQDLTKLLAALPNNRNGQF